MRIRLYADYAAWPIWGPRGGPLDEDELPLSEPLRHRIRAWFNAYNGNSRPDWPLWVGPAEASGDAEDDAWVAEGAAIRDLIAAELGPAYEVEFQT